MSLSILSIGAAGGCWAEEYVARRNAAAAYLGAQREQGLGHECLPYWRVPGFVSLFDDGQMMDWARQRGWAPISDEQDHDRAATPVSSAARGATPRAPGAGANCPKFRPGAELSMEAEHG